MEFGKATTNDASGRLEISKRNVFELNVFRYSITKSLTYNQNETPTENRLNFTYKMLDRPEMYGNGIKGNGKHQRNSSV